MDVNRQDAEAIASARRWRRSQQREDFYNEVVGKSIKVKEPSGAAFMDWKNNGEYPMITFAEHQLAE